MPSRRLALLCTGLLAALQAACAGDPPAAVPDLSRPRIERNQLLDASGRFLSFHGVNVAGSSKVPAWVREPGKTWRRFTLADLDLRPTAYDASFTGRPFAVDPGWSPSDDLDKPNLAMGFDNVRAEIRKLRDAGFDSFRLLVMWEGIEPRRKGQYDQEYLHYLKNVVSIAAELGVYILVDFHHDMVSRYITARYNDAPTWKTGKGEVVRAEPESLESMVLALFPPYTDQVRGDGMPGWAVQAALPEKDMRPENVYWGMPRVVSQFTPDLLCKVYKLYTFATADPDAEPSTTDQLVEFACSKIDPESPNYEPDGGREAVCEAVVQLSDEDLDPWLKHVARYACNTETPIGTPGTDPAFPPDKSVDMLPFSQWSIGYIVSVDCDRANAAFFGSDKAFPGLYVRECLDGRANRNSLTDCPADKVVMPTHTVCRDEGRETWQVEGCKQVQEEYWTVRDYLQDAYAGAWVSVVRALEGLPNVMGYDVMNEPIGFNLILAIQALVQLGNVNDDAILDLVKNLIDDPVLSAAIARIVPALGLIPSLPALPPEPVAPVAPEAPAATTCDAPVPGASDAEKQAYATCLADLAAWLKAKAAFDADLAAYKARTTPGPDGKSPYEADMAAAEAKRKAVLKSWGLVWEGPDSAEPSKVTNAKAEFSLELFNLIDLNTSFDWSYLRPFYQRIGAAILEVDPDALLYIEGSMGIGSVGYDLGMPTPDGLENHIVYAPHHYEDIYPFLGFNMNPRDFKVEEIAYLDYTQGMKGAAQLATDSLGNAPVVFGEFGAYYNLNGIEQSIADDYLITRHIYDNYFEGFESLFASRMMWCYSPDNTKDDGDLWNKEDFSIQGFDGKWRAEETWARPHARALAGEPLSTHFYSPLHLFSPDKGMPDPVGEFEVRYKAKRTDAPTMISIPYDVQYPDGFFVWLSDGAAFYDHAQRTLYHQPSDDAPGAVHWVRILPPIEGRQALGWRYFFRGDAVVTGD
jgi:aryl-phospho-beta-D-glucosidase BglC (GH1 family)